jgi:hypothetical protein
MNDLLKTYTADVDLLLTEICMTAAMYGLDQAATAIADHLRDQPRTEGAALLAMALSKTAIRDYNQAIAMADKVIDNPQLASLHEEAFAFRGLAEQLRGGATVQPLKVAERR